MLFAGKLWPFASRVGISQGLSWSEANDQVKKLGEGDQEVLQEIQEGGREADGEVLDAVAQASAVLVVQHHQDAAGRREHGFHLDTCRKLELEPKTLKPKP